MAVLISWILGNPVVHWLKAWPRWFAARPHAGIGLSNPFQPGKFPVKVVEQRLGDFTLWFSTGLLQFQGRTLQGPGPQVGCGPANGICTRGSVLWMSWFARASRKSCPCAAALFKSIYYDGEDFPVSGQFRQHALQIEDLGFTGRWLPGPDAAQHQVNGLHQVPGLNGFGQHQLMRLGIQALLPGPLPWRWR